MADCLAALMTDVLGYRRFGAQGGDWGAGIASRLGAVHPEKLIGIHLNYLMAASRAVNPAADYTEEERRYLETLDYWMREESAYTLIQGTKPQTLSFALTDSPAGLAAWLVEKFRTWSDCGGDVESAINRDRMLANVMLYWLTGAIRIVVLALLRAAARLTPSAACRDGGRAHRYAEFPHEILKPPRAAAARVFTDIRRWTAMPRGGHFAALEQPEALADEIRAFFHELR